MAATNAILFARYVEAGGTKALEDFKSNNALKAALREMDEIVTEDAPAETFITSNEDEGGKAEEIVQEVQELVTDEDRGHDVIDPNKELEVKANDDFTIADYEANLYTPAPTTPEPAQSAEINTQGKGRRKGNINPQPIIDKAVASASKEFGVSITWHRTERVWYFTKSGETIRTMTSREIAPIFRDKTLLKVACSAA